MQVISHELKQPIAFLQKIMHQGGPATSEYEELAVVVNQLYDEYKAGHFSQIDLQILQQSFGPTCLRETLHGHSISKPYGYAGDFMIIDKIYREHVTADKHFEKWDQLWHSLAATQAVRNRKDYFKQVMTKRLTGRKTTDLLNVASGPARDLSELYALIQPDCLNTICIEADERAIAYAQELTKGHEDHIRFIQKNIFRYEANTQFDITWSAGLFDYFTDAVFVKMLRKFVSWTKTGGEIIIGNFSADNPSRSFMEFFGDWYLHHRSASTLVGLALEAGIAKRNTWVEQECEGVNLFLHVRI